MKARNLLLIPALMQGVLLGAAALSGREVTLTVQSGSALERQAAKLMASDLRAARKAHEKPLLLVGSAPIAPGRTALFAQAQSATLCGSAGCSTSVFLPFGHHWTRVLDSVSGPVEVSPAMHGGVHDLIVDGRDRWIWSGAAYRDTLPVH